MEARRAIVAVKWGPLGGRKAVLAPGDVLRVGRGERAGLVVPHDEKMAALHLELAWDGAQLRFRDLETAAGTLKNGEAGHADGELRSGDWLKAGETVLTVHVEGTTPPRPDEDDEDARRARLASGERALAALRDEAEKAPLHAVLDAARDRRILELCRESVDEYQSLYDGVEGETMAHVAPHLVRFARGSRLLPALVREGWGRRWGIWLTSRQPFLEVRRHLRRFLMVELEGSEERMYFRYYDPVALAAFLPSCSPRQEEELFGGVEAFLFEAASGALEIRRAER